MSDKISGSYNKQQRTEIYENLVQYGQNMLNKEQSRLLQEFIPRYYANVSVEDLEARNIADLYGSLLSHWNLIFERKPNETKVRVFNPYFEKHGWQSKHTIIEIADDNMPFLVDSTRIELNRRGLSIHLCVHTGGIKVQRNEKNQIIEILSNGQQLENSTTEAPILFEIDRITDPKTLDEIKEKFEGILAEVQVAVNDWKPMRARLEQCVADLSIHTPDIDSVELSEYKEILQWLNQDQFTFLGARDYKLTTHDGKQVFELIDNSSLGILKDASHAKRLRYFDELPEAAQKLLLSQTPVVFTKRSKLSRVHRSDYYDRIEVKHFDENLKVTGVSCFLGLYTSIVFNSRPKDIPLIRTKVAQVMANARLDAASHGGKELLNILETLPRDYLFHCSVEELTDMVLGILYLQERRLVRMFLMRDIYCRFVSVLVYIPRDRFDSTLRQKMQDILAETFNAKEITFATRFSESILARVHFLIHVEPENFPEYDPIQLEQKLAAEAELWSDHLRYELVEIFGEEQGNLLANRYGEGFPAGYMENYSARTGAYDITHLEQLSHTHDLSMNLYQPIDSRADMMQFKIYGHKDAFPLSDVLPILENMGLKVIGEQPYTITPKDKQPLTIIDFTLSHRSNGIIDLDEIKSNFHDTFANIWAGLTENDGFNRLVLASRLNFREVIVLRAYSKYLTQIRLAFSQSYIESALSNNQVLARLLVDLFITRFNPEIDRALSISKQASIEQEILNGLDAVSNFDEDRIIRRFLEVIKATIRTNYFQTHSETKYKSYLSFKFNPELIAELPLPKPKFEIFVYSPRFEGVHLRGARVARGGLRWSDRREDFRTEILGLMKAQQVKNTVIVPSGAKGGFVVKALAPEWDRDAIMREVISCYQNFIRGLLDLTDNLHGDKIILPSNVVRYDEDDIYLVVAADKGTASFSDIANAVSAEYNFWLSDAFASGGSAGYDHKKIAITAKGAWECVKRHFRTINLDIQNQDFTVIGIGDLSGDVFGNGMLLSQHIKLVAAFDHRHIFLDPNPDPTKSFLERQRMFNLPRSSWEDYDQAIISPGGGVYKRTLKSIKLSEQMQSLLQIKETEIVPADLIRAILRASVDLLWNGGIGTFVKATNELHHDVGDRTNDGIRINGAELRCKVVGEGGNLGFTQLGRVEYEQHGGLINTDFIDNSGGVDCSDREVNIKILLNRIIDDGDLTLKQRNQLLSEMTNEVAGLVTRTNYAQSQAITLATLQARENPELFVRYITHLEEVVNLNRALEYLPDDKTLNERKLQGAILTRPEIAVLLAYSKINIKQELLQSTILEEPDFMQYVVQAFPSQLRNQFSSQMQQHRLRREIITNILTNDMVNYVGLTFAYRLYNETGCSIGEIVKAYLAAAQIFDFYDLWAEIEKLDAQVNSAVQERMMIVLVRMIRRATRWLLRNRHSFSSVSETITYFKDGISLLRNGLHELLIGVPREAYEHEYDEMCQQGVPESVAAMVASCRIMFSAFDIIEASKAQDIDLFEFSRFYFLLGHNLELGWLRKQLNNYIVQNQWESMAISALRDDLDWRQRALVATVLDETSAADLPEKRIEIWLQRRQTLLARWQILLNEMRSSVTSNLIMYGVALRELFDLNLSPLASKDPLPVKTLRKKVKQQKQD